MSANSAEFPAQTLNRAGVGAMARLRVACLLALMCLCTLCSANVKLPFLSKPKPKEEPKLPKPIQWAQKTLPPALTLLGKKAELVPQLALRGLTELKSAPIGVVAVGVALAFGVSDGLRGKVIRIFTGSGEIKREPPEIVFATSRGGSRAASRAPSEDGRRVKSRRPQLRNSTRTISLNQLSKGTQRLNAGNASAATGPALAAPPSTAPAEDKPKEAPAQAQPAREEADATAEQEAGGQEAGAPTGAGGDAQPAPTQEENKTAEPKPPVSPPRNPRSLSIQSRSASEQRGKVTHHQNEGSSEEQQFQSNIVFAHQYSMVTPPVRSPRGVTPQSTSRGPSPEPFAEQEQPEAQAPAQGSGQEGQDAAQAEAQQGAGGEAGEEQAKKEAEAPAADAEGSAQPQEGGDSPADKADAPPEAAPEQQASPQEETPKEPAAEDAKAEEQDGAQQGGEQQAEAAEAKPDDIEPDKRAEDEPELETAPEHEAGPESKKDDAEGATPFGKGPGLASAVDAAVKRAYSRTWTHEAAHSIDAFRNQDTAPEKRSWAHELTKRSQSFAQREHAPLDLEDKETWAKETAIVEAGCLLASNPESFRFDEKRQMFDQSVVLLVQHGERGSTGFIINRPSAYRVGHVTDDFKEFTGNPVYVGGDLGEAVYIMHGIHNVKDSSEVCDGIYLGGAEDAAKLIDSKGCTSDDFRFFYKYAAWRPGQLEEEIQQGAWCPIKTSLDIVLNPPYYEGLHLAKYHKVFWHQLLQTVGGRLKEVSEKTITKEEKEFLKFEEWEEILNDVGANVTLKNHEGVELGALAMATVTNELQMAEIEGVHSQIARLVELAQKKLGGGGETPREVLEALSSVFFGEFEIVDMPTGVVAQELMQDTIFIHQVLKRRKGTVLALAPVYLAAARDLGVPLRLTNCTAQFMNPVDFFLRWDDRKGGGQPLVIDLTQNGLVMSFAEALGRVPGGASPGGLNPVPHIKLYSRFMHTLANSFYKVKDQEMTFSWLAQLRVLQEAIDSRLMTLDQQDPTGQHNLWPGTEPPSTLQGILSLLGNELLRPDGTYMSAQELQGKYVGVYFSANWCTPCKDFTPRLVQTYKQVKEVQGKPFEIVWVSSDRNQKAFDQYIQEMPWLAIPFPQEDDRTRLGDHLAVDSIPHLVILRPDGTVLSQDGRRFILQDPSGENFPWTE